MVLIDKDSLMHGIGIETSQVKSLKNKKIKHIKKEYNNVYSLNEEVDFESLDFIYNNNSINTTKFSIILVFEWIKYLKKNGHLIITFKENKLLNEKKARRIYNQFFSKNCELIQLKKQGDEVTFILKKIKSLKIKDDSINKWTFGIITIGNRNEWVKKFIESVRAQKIPNYEIIIVGTWFDPDVNKKDIKYISFNQKDDKGWITKKKNIIFEKAKYNNVLVLHDRFYLDKNWFSGMKKYGNFWDALFFPIIDKKGFEYVHWSVWGHGFLPIGYALIKDWGEDYFVGGTFMAIKKNVWLKAKLNEKLFWNDQEDSEHGLRFTKNGFVMRANPYAKLHTTVTYFYDAPVYQYDFKKLGKPVEHRGKKWIIIQRLVDVLTRVVGLPFLRTRRKIGVFLRKKFKTNTGVISGGKRD